MEQAALLAGGEHGDGVGRARGAQVGALEGIDRDVHGRVVRVGLALGGADFFADEKHRGFVALALADDDGAVHRHGVHHLAHRFHGDVVGLVAVALAHGAGCVDGRLFHHAKEFGAETFFHGFSDLAPGFSQAMPP